MIHINKDTCIQCGQCVKACPFGILETKDAYPSFIQSKNSGCIKCMHCVAICSQKAFAFEGVKSCDILSDNTVVNDETYALLTKIIKQRRSIRNYKTTLVPDEIITEILETIKWAPSAKNQHPTRWLVISGKESIDSVMELVLAWAKETGNSPEIISEYENGNNVVTCDAPHLLIAYAKTDTINPSADSVIALTSADLLFYTKGIGTCFAGYLSRIANAYSPLSTQLGIPQGHSIYGALMFGYPKAETYKTIPAR